jgi:hypothetical protein
MRITLCLLAAWCGGCATTNHERAGGIAEDANLARGAAIAIMRPDVSLYSLLASGLEEPRADWTDAARANIQTALIDELRRRGATAHLVNDFDASADPQRARQLFLLHEAVGYSALVHGVGQTKLPHKAGFDWTLGPGARALDPTARYGLFVFLRDSYATDGRKAMAVALALAGVGVSTGQQVGFASLVDLDSGRLVWFNVLAAARGDVRELDKARQTIGLLLDGAPL